MGNENKAPINIGKFCASLYVGITTVSVMGYPNIGKILNHRITTDLKITQVTILTQPSSILDTFKGKEQMF
jgi:hypothetical protein